MMSSEESSAKTAVTETETGEEQKAETPESTAETGSSPEANAEPEQSSDAADAPDDKPPASPPAASEPAPTTEAAPKRRVQLNPTFNSQQARAVPTVETAKSPAVPAAVPASPRETPAAEAGDAEQPDEQAADSETPATQTQAASASRADIVPAHGPVEIPRGSQDLDAEMEAEIAAAMASGELNTEPVIPPAAGEGESQDDTPPPPETEDELESGMHLPGKIQSVHGDDVFLDVGYRSPGVLPVRQFAQGKKPEVGQIIDTVVDRYNVEEGLILLNLPRGLRRPAGNWDAVGVGQVVDCMVMKTNKGGLEVNVGNLRAFMPASQVDLGFVSNLEDFVGQKLRAEVTEVNPKKRKLVVSRRNFLQKERAELEQELWQTLQVGKTCTGKVKTIKDYGAFVDIGGVDGFLHIGEISHSRIRHPSDVLSEGQQVDVQVISLDPGKKRVGLGMKQLVADPWKEAPATYPVDSAITGKVTRIADFGAFVELEPGVEGLVHISEVDHSRIRRVADVLKVGQDVEAKVLEVDPDRNRISLSIKALKAKPEDPRGARTAGEPEQSYERKRKGPLKGGTSDEDSKPGGLFGNPNDFG